MRVGKMSLVGLAVAGGMLALTASVQAQRVKEEWVARYNGPGNHHDSARAMAIDDSGNVYVAGGSRGDVTGTDWATIKYAPTGEVLWLVRYNSPDNRDDVAADVAVDSEGDVYVSDWGNRRVQIYDPEGGTITALYGDAVEFSSWAKEVVESNPDVVKAYRRVKDKTALGLFSHPVGMAIDEEDRLIVTDTTRGRLQVYAKEKNYLDPQFNL